MSEEERREHSQRMESVGQLTGGLAHDFNNLLTVIHGNLQALQEVAAVQQDPDCAPLIAAALRATQRGAELTRSLLAFSRRQTLAPASIDPVAMLRSLLAMLRRTVDQRMQIELQPPYSCPACVADPALLESALLNIALNARDAMPQGGTLSCRAEACDALPPDAEYDPDALGPADQAFVAISMQDSGCGMAPEVLERVFEPFFTTKEAGRGTGLGLSTVYGFIRQSRGAIGITSAPGQGTCITLYLPRERRTVPRSEPARTRPVEALRGLDVILVEDDLEVMAVSLSFLAHFGCEVRAYGSAEHALLALEREAPPALLLSDVALGDGISGTELAQRVQARWPQVRVLLMSGYLPEPGDMDPAVARLAKPFSREQMADAMLGLTALV